MRNNSNENQIIELSKSTQSDLGFFGILPSDVSKLILSKLPISERHNVRLVCRSWALFADSPFVRRSMASSMIPWIIENFADSLKNLPIDAKELCEFLENDALTLDQKIVGLNNLPRVLFDFSEVSSENQNFFPREYFLNSKEKIDTILRSVLFQNRQNFANKASNELNKLFQKINIFLIEALRLSLGKSDKDIAFFFQIESLSDELIAHLNGQKRVQMDEIFEMPKNAENLSNNFSEAYAMYNVSEDTQLARCASKPVMIFALLLGLGMIVGGPLLIRSVTDKTDNDFPSAFIGVFGGALMVGVGVALIVFSVFSCYLKRQSKQELSNFLEVENPENEAQKIEANVLENKTEIPDQQADEVQINMEEDELFDESENDFGMNNDETPLLFRK